MTGYNFSPPIFGRTGIFRPRKQGLYFPVNNSNIGVRAEILEKLIIRTNFAKVMDESLTQHGLKSPDITKSRFRWDKEDK